MPMLVAPLLEGAKLVIGGVEAVVLVPAFLFGWAFVASVPFQIFCWFLLALWILRKPWRQLLNAIRSRQ